MTESTVSAAGKRIVKLLVGKPPQSIADLIKATGVTRTAVTEQLNELINADLVERTMERLKGRGRPRYLYTATDAALVRLFRSNQHLVVPAMWGAIHNIGGPRLVRRVLKRVSSSLARHYGRKVSAKDPAHRFRELGKAFREEGGLVDVLESNGRLKIRKRSCPFIGMLDDERRICCVDREMMCQVVGAPVRRTTYRLDGAPCCVFELLPRKRRRK